MTRRRLWATGLGAVGILALVGVAHMPGVQRLVGVDCPFGRAPDAKKLEDLRLKTAANMRGASAAPVRPAFGFKLDASTREDVLAWGARVSATCTDALGSAAVRCEGARLDEGLPAADAFFRFDPAGKLVGVDVMREAAPAEAACAFFEELLARRTQELGAPASAPKPGSATPAVLASTRFARAGAEFRFTDYAADVSVSNFDGEHTDPAQAVLVVREQYRSLATSTHVALQAPSN